MVYMVSALDFGLVGLFWFRGVMVPVILVV